MARSLIPDLKEDLNSIVMDYVKLNTTSFSDFLHLWKEKNFDMIFGGQGEFEIDYFIFHIIHVAKSYCGTSKGQLERVAGLYLLYLLYYTQPLKQKKSIRVIPEELNNLRVLADEFKRNNKEVSYAFYKLLLDNAFDFVITPLPYDENLIHLKEEHRNQRQHNDEDSAAQSAIIESVLKQTNFQVDQWSRMVSDYNTIKKKINNCCSLNLSLTKPLDDI